MFDQNPKIVLPQLFPAPAGWANLQPSINTKKKKKHATLDMKAGLIRNIVEIEREIIPEQASELVPACISQV